MFARQFFHLFADEDVRVKLFRRAFQPRGEVHAVAEHGEFHALRMADVADDDFAVVDADADGQFFAVGIFLPARVQFRQRPRICNAAVTARCASASMPLLCVSPQTAMIASPMNFCSVPFFLQNAADHVAKNIR